MKTRLVFGALLAAMAIIGPTWDADAQSRSNSGGYTRGGAITSPGGITRNTPGVRVAPVMRPSPSLPPGNPVITPRYGTSGFYQNNIGNVPPGSRATTVGPR